MAAARFSSETAPCVRDQALCAESLTQPAPCSVSLPLSLPRPLLVLCSWVSMTALSFRSGPTGDLADQEPGGHGAHQAPSRVFFDVAGDVRVRRREPPAGLFDLRTHQRADISRTVASICSVISMVLLRVQFVAGAR